MPVIDDWTYTSPSNSTADAVRFLIGDTHDLTPIFTDTEIAWFITENGDKYAAAAAACERLAVEIAGIEGAKIGNVVVGQTADGYLRMAAMYRQKSAMRYAAPFAGGISKAQKDATAANADLVKPAFTRRLFEGEQRVGSSEAVLADYEQ